MIGAKVIGMTVCPCAQESVEQESKEKLLEFLDEETTQKVLEAVTFASHNQRGIGTIMLEVPENQDLAEEGDEDLDPDAGKSEQQVID
jgi:GTP cyclohydrolase-4